MKTVEDLKPITDAVVAAQDQLRSAICLSNELKLRAKLSSKIAEVLAALEMLQTEVLRESDRTDDPIIQSAKEEGKAEVLIEFLQKMSESKSPGRPSRW